MIKPILSIGFSAMMRTFVSSFFYFSDKSSLFGTAATVLPVRIFYPVHFQIPKTGDTFFTHPKL